MRGILITGGAGFIGSNFINLFLEKYPKYFIVNFDKLTYAGNLENLNGLEKYDNYKFIKGDICDPDMVENVFKVYNIKGVIHFAAESHVDNSILHPAQFIKTNILGTYNLIETARKYWMLKPFEYKKEYEGSRFHHISTDEVYGALGAEGYFTEKTSYAPNSPYSASKAGSDFIVRSYYHTFGVNVVITNCSNNYGPKQHDEKFIPTIIRNALSGNKIPIYGSGENIRDWLFVEDHCRAIDLVYHKGEKGETYNIGTKNEIKNIDLAYKICRELDSLKPLKDSCKYESLISLIEDRPGHDFRYSIDPTKIETELEFSSKVNFNIGLLKTIKWYLEKYR